MHIHSRLLQSKHFRLRASLRILLLNNSEGGRPLQLAHRRALRLVSKHFHARVLVVYGPDTHSLLERHLLLLYFDFHNTTTGFRGVLDRGGLECLLRVLWPQLLWLRLWDPTSTQAIWRQILLISAEVVIDKLLLVVEFFDEMGLGKTCRAKWKFTHPGRCVQRLLLRIWSKTLNVAGTELYDATTESLITASLIKVDNVSSVGGAQGRVKRLQRYLLWIIQCRNTLTPIICLHLRHCFSKTFLLLRPVQGFQVLTGSPHAHVNISSLIIYAIEFPLYLGDLAPKRGYLLRVERMP